MSKKKTSPRGRRARGSGRITREGDDRWRVDIELPRDTVTGKRRRVSRTVRGTREDAELYLSRLKVTSHQKKLPYSGTSARSVGAAMQLYIEAAQSGYLELAPQTIRTSRSAIHLMSDMELGDGRRFGAILLSRLTWEDMNRCTPPCVDPDEARTGFVGAAQFLPDHLSLPENGA